MGVSTNVGELLEKLTGQPIPRPDSLTQIQSFPSNGLGYSQFNEILLLLGYDRVTQAFFQFLVNGELDYVPGSDLRSLADLESGVERARKISLLFFGNVKFGFKTLARNTDELSYFHQLMQPSDEAFFRKRHEAIFPIDLIDPNQTYYLGYVVQRELADKISADPMNSAALAEQAILLEVRARGMRNQHAYLVSDHLDVYVATSMRRRHEYVEIGEFTNSVFRHDRLRGLNLRWFDPTQAYCSDRIDKGLAEALMLKRAKCTLYLAQESDTLGKDSELASTLAQGKPVIAYVPSPTESEIRASVACLSEMYGQPMSTTVLDRLQMFSPALAWTDAEVRRWLDAPAEVDTERALALLVKTACGHYDRRANTLREDHPLGVQVNLDTGVANGVLVVRNVDDCAEVLYRILTGRLEFSIETRTVDCVEYQLLRESISGSIFRVMTGDAMLTNSFWNFYLDPSE